MNVTASPASKQAVNIGGHSLAGGQSVNGKIPTAMQLGASQSLSSIFRLARRWLDGRAMLRRSCDGITVGLRWSYGGKQGNSMPNGVVKLTASVHLPAEYQDLRQQSNPIKPRS